MIDLRVRFTLGSNRFIVEYLNDENEKFHDLDCIAARPDSR